MPTDTVPATRSRKIRSRSTDMLDRVDFETRSFLYFLFVLTFDEMTEALSAANVKGA